MNENVKIGFDAKRIVSNASGLGNYGRTLVNSLTPRKDCPQLLLYAPDEGRKALREQVDADEKVRFVYSGHRCGLMKDCWRSAQIVRQLQRDGVAIFHGLSGELPRGIRKTGIKSVVTIHDLIFMHHPQYYHPIDVWLYKRKFYRTVRQADRIVAISECTKRDILRYADYPEDRIDVVYQSCNDTFSKPATEEKTREVMRKYALPRRFLLSVGTIEPRKNALTAAKALRYLPKEVKLVIVGRPTAYAGKIEKYAAEHALKDRILMLHNVPNADLPAIYQLADVFVYPSYYEGFGIPVIEAIQSGLPVVAAKGSCLEEAGGPASFYADPDDDKTMGELIGNLLGNETLRQKSTTESRKFVQKFESHNVAAAMMREYEKLLNKRR